MITQAVIIENGGSYLAGVKIEQLTNKAHHWVKDINDASFFLIDSTADKIISLYPELELKKVAVNVLKDLKLERI